MIAESQAGLFFPPAADGRHGIVRVDRVPLACKLVDLPCMIESLKTVDKKTFYKTADVCQVNGCGSIRLKMLTKRHYRNFWTIRRT